MFYFIVVSLEHYLVLVLFNLLSSFCEQSYNSIEKYLPTVDPMLPWTEKLEF
jgi:hypothetical protein